MTSSPTPQPNAPARLAGTALDEALAQSGDASGIFSVILGRMRSGKNAVGLSFVRNALKRKGHVVVIQPGAPVQGAAAGRVAYPPLRTPKEIEARLAKSLSRLEIDKEWRQRVRILTSAHAHSWLNSVASCPEDTHPEQPLFRMLAFAMMQSDKAPVVPGSSLFPAEVSSIHDRMLVVQDYGLARQSEPMLTPSFLRALALKLRANVVAMVDVTGADRDVALLSSITSCAPSGKPSGAYVRVHADQVDLLAAAHRLYYVFPAQGGGVEVHTLKSPTFQVGAAHLELDPGYLVWPPERLSEAPPRQRDTPEQAQYRETQDGGDAEGSVEAIRGDRP